MSASVVTPLRGSTNPGRRSNHSEMTTCVEMITPAQAADLLTRNLSNRKLRGYWVNDLSNIIRRGEWKITHQGIAITPDNELLDGQHRLHAVVKTGISVPMNVSYDVPADAFLVIDGGVKRSTSDHLAVTSMTATIGKLLWQLQAPENRVPTSAEVGEVLAWALPSIDTIAQVVNAQRRGARAGASVQMPLCVHIMAGRTEILPQLEAFKSLDFEHMTPSLQSLMRQIISKKASTRGNQWDLSARVWRAFHPENWDITRIQLSGTEVALSEMVSAVEQFRRKAA